MKITVNKIVMTKRFFWQNNMKFCRLNSKISGFSENNQKWSFCENLAFLPLFIFSVSIFEMLIIDFILFDSVLTFLWFRTSIFSFRSVRLLWLSRFRRSLVRPLLKLWSASNFRLLSLTNRTAFFRSYRVFLSNLLRQPKLFGDLWIFITIFKVSSAQFLLSDNF